MSGNDSQNRFSSRPGDLLPREKMRRLASARDMADEDLLAILLKTGSHGCDVLELARRLIALFGSLGQLVEADWRTLNARIRENNADPSAPKILGVGEVKVLELAAAFELARRSRHLQRADFERIRLGVDSASAAYRLFAPFALAEEQETFFVLPVDSARHAMSEPIPILRGTADGLPVHPRDVFRESVRWGAHALFVAHNHPCGNPTPSEADLSLTRKLVAVGRLHGIPLHDHLVLGAPGSAGGKGYVSIRNIHPEIFL